MKKILLTLLVAFFALPSCSNDTKECSEQPKCPQCETCETCEVCAECPTCKDGDECPDCNTDALNSQLASCNNELTTTKQELKTQKEANESCVGDLDSCNAEKNELSAKPRSKSGSRLIFKEHKMADGSVYVEPYPYDTKLQTTCTFTQKEFGFCCIASILNISWEITTFRSLYLDSSCSKLIADLTPEERYGVLINNCLKVGQLVVRNGAYNYCTNEYNSQTYFKIKSVYTMYKKQNDNCVKYEGDYPLVELEPVSLDEVKSYFVCEE
ncbi:MAG: hypothetical protein IKY83_11125 [Proteobacteria bacterium]|nr:hypothetical protein [Pseudomonadota bacterium]